VPLKGTLGDRYISSRRHLAPSYAVLFGSMTLDLSRFRFEDEPTAVDVDMVAGHLRVYVPPGVRVAVDGTIDAGVASLFGERRAGYDVAFGDTFEHKGSTEGDLVVNFTGGVGKITMTWANWVEQEIRFRARERERRLEKRRAERDAKADQRSPRGRKAHGD
jgi:hypothetical protein